VHRSGVEGLGGGGFSPGWTLWRAEAARPGGRGWGVGVQRCLWISKKIGGRLSLPPINTDDLPSYNDLEKMGLTIRTVAHSQKDLCSKWRYSHKQRRRFLESIKEEH